jgi:hypothetical protein
MTAIIGNTLIPRHQEMEKTVCSPKLRRVKRQMRIFLELSGISQKAVEIDMGVPKGTLTTWIQDGYPNAMGVHHLPDWTREVGPEFENWLQEQNDQDNVSSLITQPPMTLAAMLARISGQEVAALIQDIQSGGVWDANERNGRLPGLHKLRSIVDALIVEAEGHGLGAGKVS